MRHVLKISLAAAFYAVLSLPVYALDCPIYAPTGGPAPSPSSFNWEVNAGALNVPAPGLLTGVKQSNGAGDLPNWGITQCGTGPSHGALALNGDGSFTYTPVAGYSGMDSFTAQTHDIKTGQASNTTTIFFNTAVIPVVANDSYSTNQNATLTVNAPGVLSNDTLGGSQHALTVKAPGTFSVSSGTLVLNANGGFVFTPTHNVHATNATFSYQATDTFNTSAGTASITIAINTVTPLAAADSIAVNQGATVTTLVGGGTNVLTNDSDADGDPLTAVVVTQPAHGTLTLNSIGTFSYTQNNSANATDSFTYKACDNATPQTCSTAATVSIAVTLSTSTTPVAVADAIALNQGATATTLVSNATSVLTNDSDADHDPLTAAVVTQPTHGSLNLNSSGTFSYTQNGSANATDSFTYKACDNGTPQKCSTPATVSITVNLKPTIACVPPAQIVVESKAFTLNAGPLFADPEQQTLTYLATGLPGGLSIGSSTGTVSGTPSVGDAASSPYAATLSGRDPQLNQSSEGVKFVALTATDYLFVNGFGTAGAICP